MNCSQHSLPTFWHNVHRHLFCLFLDLNAVLMGKVLENTRHPHLVICCCKVAGDELATFTRSHGQLGHFYFFSSPVKSLQN